MPKDKVSGIKMEDGKIFHYGVRVGMLDFKIFNIIFKEADRLIGPCRRYDHIPCCKEANG